MNTASLADAEWNNFQQKTNNLVSATSDVTPTTTNSTSSPRESGISQKLKATNDVHDLSRGLSNIEK